MITPIILLLFPLSQHFRPSSLEPKYRSAFTYNVIHTPRSRTLPRRLLNHRQTRFLLRFLIPLLLPRSPVIILLTRLPLMPRILMHNTHFVSTRMARKDIPRCTADVNLPIAAGAAPAEID